MPLAFYMDQHVPRAITLGLRLRGVEVITAYEDGTSEMEDPDLLDRAGALERVLFTRDDDLLAEATKRQRAELPFAASFMRTNCGCRSGLACRIWKSSPRQGSPKTCCMGLSS
jgi:predicted nuclease of predicted toxin-antitoxin system